MNLSPEDNLRLNVLLCQDVKAIRINDSQLILYALLNDKEISVKLTANCSEDEYVKHVKAFLSSQILDSPAGYPVFLKRWTRMGHLTNEKIGELLKLAEPEAVIAVIYANHISIEHAQYAWWANSSVEVARQLLSHQNIVKSKLAGELSQFLLEFLPFETEAKDIITDVKLLVDNQLITQQEINSLWKKGKRKAAYLIGFLHCNPKYLTSVSAEYFPAINISHCIFSHEEQIYIQTCLAALDRFSDQDSIVLLYETMQIFFANLRQNFLEKSISNNELYEDLSKAINILSNIQQQDLIPILSHSNAVGSLLRKKLGTITDPIKYQLTFLVKNA